MFLHPYDNRRIDVELSSDMTAREAIQNLIDSEFIKNISNSDGYKLAILGGFEMQDEQTFEEAQVKDDTVLSISLQVYTCHIIGRGEYCETCELDGKYNRKTFMEK